MKNPFYRFKAGEYSTPLTININHVTSYAVSDMLLQIWLSDNDNPIAIHDFSVEDMDFLLARHFDYDEVKEAADVIKI